MHTLYWGEGELCVLLHLALSLSAAPVAAGAKANRGGKCQSIKQAIRLCYRAVQHVAGY